jgi:hypothetical protein
MIRPENMRVISDKALAKDENIIAGELHDTLITGAMIKHFVRLPNGSLVTVQELANERRTTVTPGSGVYVSWPVDAGIFLNR